VLPPESERPDHRFLQAQLRLLLARTDSSKPGLPFAAGSIISRALRADRARQPEFVTGEQGGSGRLLASGD